VLDLQLGRNNLYLYLIEAIASLSEFLSFQKFVEFFSVEKFFKMQKKIKAAVRPHRWGKFNGKIKMSEICCCLSKFCRKSVGKLQHAARFTTPLH